MDTISIRKYAALKGCSEGNVRAAIKTGKISKGVSRDDNGKVKGIIIDVANKEWSDNYNLDRIRNPSVLESFSGKPLAAKTELGIESIKEISTGKELVFDIKSELESVDEREDIREAKRKEAVFKAQLLGLQVLERKKELIDTKKVYKALFDFSAQTSSAIMAIPDRIIDNLFACETRAEAYSILSTSLNEALTSLSNSKPKGL